MNSNEFSHKYPPLFSKRILPVTDGVHNLKENISEPLGKNDQASSVNNDIESIVTKIKGFQEAREWRKHRKFSVIWNFGLLTLVVFFSLNIACTLISVISSLPNAIKIVLSVFATIFLILAMLGFMIVSTVDPAEMDFDDVINKNDYRSFIIRICTFLILFFDAVSWYGFFGIAAAIFMVWCLVFLIPNKYSGRLLFSYRFIISLIIDELIAVMSFGYNTYETATNGNFTYRLIPGINIPGVGGYYPAGNAFFIPFMVITIFSFIELVFLISYSTINLKKYYSDSRNGLSPTSLMYIAFYLYLNRYGICNIIRAAVNIHFINNPTTDTQLYLNEYPGPIYDYLSLVTGILTVLPPIIVFILGPKNVFNFTARRFDRAKENLQMDGSFIAELLASLDVTLGQIYWVHYTKCNRPQRQEFNDHRKNFYEGVIIEIENYKFDVKLIEISEEGQIVYMERKTDMIKEKKLVTNETISMTNEEVIANDVETGDENSDPMINMAIKNFRCIDWTSITKELFTVSVRDKSAIKLYDLSRPLKNGESVSFFISHAWDDEGELKYDALKKIADSYKAINFRYPTFWFDKVCFDQDNLSDGLKVLPINVMMCEKVLVLYGSKYVGRLWCIWELFTLFSFTNTLEALKRLKLSPLSPSLNLSIDLKAFDVNMAHCYDPNEEIKIRNVITATGGANGENEFNEKIRRLGDYLSSMKE